MPSTRALLVIQEPVCCDTLSSLLRAQSVETSRAADAQDALQRLGEQPADLVFVDFTDAGMAASLLEALRPARAATSLFTVLLLRDESERGMAVKLGAHFVMYEPASQSQVRSVLAAANALMHRERRRTTRVPVQVPVALAWDGADEVEGILLDVSATGVDVLAAQPLPNLTDVKFHFLLPDSDEEITGKGVVAWARANGEGGIRFESLSDGSEKTIQQWVRSTAQPAPPKGSGIPCRLTDLSLGGCYVESEAPFPIGTKLDLQLRAGEMQTSVEGLVCVLHPGYGMGIEFLVETGEQRQAVEDFLQFLMSRPGVTPELRAIPREILDVERVLEDVSEQDALLHLLRHENGMRQADFLEELQRQRGGGGAEDQHAAEISV